MTNQDTEFFVDDKPFTTRKPELTVSEVLALRGVPDDLFFLLSENGTDYRDPSEIVQIHQGDRFATRKRDDARPDGITHYTVNGEAQTTERDSLTVEQVLLEAGAAASIDVAEIANYFLENVADGRKYENLTDDVDINDGDQFLAVHVGRTPVA